MKVGIRFDESKAREFLEDGQLKKAQADALEAAKKLLTGTGKGNDMLGWVDLPCNYDKEEFARIKKAAEKIRSDSEVVISIGIGGSYLGIKAAVEFLNGIYAEILPKEKKKNPDVYFCGCNISGSYMRRIIDILGDRDFSIIVISKSGTTTEPAIAFRIFKDILIKKYGEEEAYKRIYAVTDKARGAMKTEADANGYETFVIPDNVGGRYSVLTPVGLLPIAAAGGDIDAMMKGAADMRELCFQEDLEKNEAMRYAICRQIMYRSGKCLEILENYEPSLHSINEWCKQLMAESEGKDHKGLFPVGMDFTTDLHSLGQYIQDGQRIMFETVIDLDEVPEDIEIISDEKNLDQLNYIAGKNMSYVNGCAREGTILAHLDGGSPSFVIHVPREDEYCLGQLFYMFEFAVAVSGYMMDVNPFNQPGVEDYKRNMFALLGKPGYEEETEKIKSRMGR